MTPPLRLLIVGEDDADAERILHALRGPGPDPSWHRVRSESEFMTALDWQLDAIVADLGSPPFDAMRVLELVSEFRSDVPVIVVAGPAGEDEAILALRGGAAEFVWKDRLVRLPYAVEHAVERRRLRGETVLASEALVESERRYRGIFENVIEGIFITTLEGRYIAVNPSLAYMLGYASPEELVQSVTDVLDLYVDPGSRGEFTERVRANGRALDFEYEVRRKDGTTIWVSENATLVRDDEGSPVGFEGTSMDVTARRVAEETLQAAEARYRSLVEQVPVIIYLWSIDGDIDHVTEDFVSARIEEVLGFPAEEWMAEPALWITQMHPDDRDEVLAATARAIEKGEPYQMEYRMLHKDGHLVWIRDEAIVLERDEAGRASLMQGVQLDITAQKLVEETLRRIAEEKARLIGVLAHELFTPITLIQGAVLTMSSLGDRLDREDLSLLAEGIARGAKRLRRLVQNVSVAARLDKSDFAIARQVIPIGELLAMALQEFQTGQAKGPAINLPHCEGVAEGQIIADPFLASQAIGVVIENALDYSEGQPIDITLGVSEDGLLIRVADRGPGIPPELHEQIFELFTQVDSSDTRSHEGLGMGLFLARRVMRLHGGDLVYEAGPNGGSTFTFRFLLA